MLYNNNKNINNNNNYYMYKYTYIFQSFNIYKRQINTFIYTIHPYTFRHTMKIICYRLFGI